MSKKCINCGIELENDQLLCPACGTKQLADFQPIAENKEEAKNNLQQTTVGETNTEKAPTSPKNRKKSLAIVGIALGVCIALLLAAVLILKPTWLGFEPDNGVTDDPTTQTPDDQPTNPDGKTEYTISIKANGVRPIAKHTFYIYEGDDDLVAYAQTDENGIGKVSLKPSNNYTIELTQSVLEGYDVKDRYSFTGTSAAINLTSRVISDPDLSGVKYQLGDVMHDFTVTTTDGSTFTLSEVLKTKKAVLEKLRQVDGGGTAVDLAFLIQLGGEIAALKHIADLGAHAVKIILADTHFFKHIVYRLNAKLTSAFQTDTLVDGFPVLHSCDKNHRNPLVAP